MTTVLVLQGPNLNLVGTREPEIYGHETLDDDPRGDRGAGLGARARPSLFFQSNHEGALIDRLHERDFDVSIVNAGGLTHTSVALRDALLAIQRPFYRGPPVRSRDARAVPPGQLPPRHRPGVVRRPGRAWLPPRARGDRRRATGPAMPDRIEETAELRRLRKRIDALDRRLVELLNERASLAREAGRAKTAAGRRAVRDAEREREVLLRVSMANTGTPPAGRPRRPVPAPVRGDAGARDARSSRRPDRVGSRRWRLTHHRTPRCRTPGAAPNLGTAPGRPGPRRHRTRRGRDRAAAARPGGAGHRCGDRDRQPARARRPAGPIGDPDGPDRRPTHPAS